jgi:enoyl-[acyl-carrier protein] reductase II
MAMQLTGNPSTITQLFGIKYPIIQAGMIWASGWKLASAVSNAGGLGIIGAGSMYPEVLREHIQQCKLATNQPFAVNIPLLYPDLEQLCKSLLKKKYPLFLPVLGILKLILLYLNSMELKWYM